MINKPSVAHLDHHLSSSVALCARAIKITAAAPCVSLYIPQTSDLQHGVVKQAGSINIYDPPLEINRLGMQKKTSLALLASVAGLVIFFEKICQSF